MGEDRQARVVIRRVISRALVIAYVIVLLIATLAPLPSDAYDVVSTTGSDKVVHFFLFGGLTAVFLVARWPTARAAVAMLNTMIAAALVEVVQSPLAYRTGDLWDFVAGAGGAVVAAVATGWVVKHRG